MVRLHDTATGEMRPLELRDEGRVGLYVCGPTVYDDPHTGHGRFTLVWDILRRYLTWQGLQVQFVSNVTDIDDRIIERASREQRSTDEVTAQYEEVWYAAMDALGVQRPDSDPHATAYVEEMVALIDDLAARGVAYETSDGVQLSIDAVDGYGLLARQPLESLRAGARVDVDEEKRSPLDFALWKKAKPGEPTWPSPWGPGRPGWHTECVVMSLGILGDGFDLHGGGIDLAFPHHENERAQAVAAGREFARHWVHSGHVMMGKEKMSKSLGNFTTLTELIEQVSDPRSYRLLVLQSHYRSPLEVGPEAIADGETALRRLDDFARRTAELPSSAPDEGVLDELRAAMDDDLDTPRATALLFNTARQANVDLDAGDREAAAGKVAAVHEICRAVGLALHGGDDAVPSDIEALARRRDEARAGRDWAAADAIRDELSAGGWLVEDTPEGTRVRRG